MKEYKKVLISIIVSIIILSIIFLFYLRTKGITMIIPILFICTGISSIFIIKKDNSSLIQKTFIGSFWGLFLILLVSSCSSFFPSNFGWEFIFYFLAAIPTILLGALFGWTFGMFNRDIKKKTDWIIGICIVIFISLFSLTIFAQELFKGIKNVIEHLF